MINFSFIVKKLKLNKERFLLRQLCLLFATVMLLSVAVFAWFSNKESANASGVHVTVGTSKNLLISLDYGDTYHNGIDLLSNDTQKYIHANNKIKDKLSMQDITSDGYTFWRPVFSQTDNNRIPDTSKQWEYAAKNIAYITQEVYFKTSFPADIYMGSGTTVVPKEAEDKLTSASATNKSDGGDFSRDCIIGALRISAYNDSSKDSSSNNYKKPLFVMIPRSNLMLEQKGNVFTISTGNNLTDAKIHEYYTTKTNENTTDNYVKKTNNNPLLEFTATENNPGQDSTKIATTKKDADGNYYGTATVNIWLEGCDAETRRVLSGGKYNIVLDFVAIENAEATTTTTTTE